MALFAITYDLIKRKDYPELWEALASLGAHKAMLSFYLVNLQTDNPQAVLDYLLPHVDADDRIMVVRFVGRPKYNIALKGTNDWVTANCL